MTGLARCRILLAAVMFLLAMGTPRLSVTAPPLEAPSVQKGDAGQARARFEILLAAGLYTRWPGDSELSRNGATPVQLGVVGRGPSAGEFTKLADGKHIGSRPVVIRHFPSAADVQPCDILFITNSVERSDSLALLKRFTGAPVLLAGESPGFCRNGGSLNFHTVDGIVRFTLNHQAIAAHKLTVDPRFARLARQKVAPREGGHSGTHDKRPQANSSQPAPPHEARRASTQPHTGGSP